MDLRGTDGWMQGYIRLSKSSVALRTYSSNPLTVLGQMKVSVSYQGYKRIHILLVVQGNGSNLIGRDWLRVIRIDWASIKALVFVKTVAVDCLVEKYPNVFAMGVGTMKNIRAQLSLRQGSKPRFYRRRTVLYALKQSVGKELDCLEESGVLRKVNHVDWAGPIVPVPKKDGSIRICGNYKVTVNPSLLVDQNPLPKPSDLIAILTGGKKFTKMDMSTAYQQILLEDESAKLLTINTHQGLYQYTRLPFGVASAPALFQKAMDSILQGIPHCIFYVDDILVTGRSDAEHSKNLETVLQRLQKQGVPLKREKYSFFQDFVEYLGHTINAQGIHTTDKKVRAIVSAPSPRNLAELRGFLELLNDYSKFLPSLVSLLNPLHSLLQTGQPWKWSQSCKEAFQRA